MRRITQESSRGSLLGSRATLIGLLCLAVLGILYLGRHARPPFAMAAGSGLAGPDIDTLDKQNKAYERVVQAVTPAIVYIRTEQVVKIEQSPLFKDPFFRQFFGDQFPQMPREERQHALGSGVIIDPVGYIVTNNHVIQHASSIEVMFKDKRTYKGKVVGADPDTG